MNILTTQLYKAINENDVSREINHWHCSSIAKCPRALYFERKKVAGLPENEPGGGKKLRWRSGHAIEATIRPELEKIYPDMVANVRFTNETLDLTGEFDGYSAEEKMLISVKSIHDFAMITQQGRTGLKDKRGMKPSAKTGKPVIDWGFKQEPYIHHQWQEHGYLVLLTRGDTKAIHQDSFHPMNGSFSKTVRQEPYPIEKIAYVYITLGGLIDTFITDVNYEIASEVEAKVTYLNECWEKQVVPECTCQEGMPMFNESNQYCPYRSSTGCCDPKLLKEVPDEPVGQPATMPAPTG